MRTMPRLACMEFNLSKSALWDLGWNPAIDKDYAVMSLKPKRLDNAKKFIIDAYKAKSQMAK